MVRMPRFKTSCLKTGVKTLVTEMGQQLPPSIVCKFHSSFRYHVKYSKMKKLLQFASIKLNTKMKQKEYHHLLKQSRAVTYL